MLFIFWLVAVLFVVYGAVQVLKGEVLFGILLIVVGLLIGPGGVSLLH